MVNSPALQRGETGFHKFVLESRRDGARTLFMQDSIARIPKAMRIRALALESNRMMNSLKDFLKKERRYAN
jgi:hypothetical protein